MAGGALARPTSKARAEGRTILFVDEAAFYLLPFVARTYAPRGQTPVLHVPLTRDHLSVISAVTPEGRLFLHAQEAALRGSAVVAFLRQLLRQVRGKLLVIWDGAPIHHFTASRSRIFSRPARLCGCIWSVCLATRPS